MKKILILRFSSIGDVVLTTPVIRCIKQQLPGVEVSFVTKESFRTVVASNPYIDKLYTFKKEVSELFDVLASEKYDCLIDLHKNLRSLRLKRHLKTKNYSFDKINFQKFLAVNFKALNSLPKKHIVQRYLETVAPLGVKDDGKGLDYFIESSEEINASLDYFKTNQPVKFLALVLGGSYVTKKIPLSKLKEICYQSSLPIILLGGKEDKVIADELQKEFPSLYNTCGSLSINQSASLVKQCEWIITSDTGMMHIASAFQKKIISVWGNTIPEFGMSPYLPLLENKILELKDLKCRPCSKLGFSNCPAGHFNCMQKIDFSFVSELQ
ncbi:MAG: glycosyltransferase family 9 protein [bacterium]|nr:glycosyltransferase family 9 protein [bacterium]